MCHLVCVSQTTWESQKVFTEEVLYELDLEDQHDLFKSRSVESDYRGEEYAKT